MSDMDKLRIKELDEKSYDGLWKISVEAACSAKVVDSALVTTRDGITVQDTQKITELSIIVIALSDFSLRVVRAHTGDSVKIMEKLDATFDSRSTATKISKITALVSGGYSSVKIDIKKHIDLMAAILEQLKSMKAIMDDTVQVGTLIAYIDVPDLNAMTAAIKTLAEEDIKWEIFTEKLIE